VRSVDFPERTVADFFPSDRGLTRPVEPRARVTSFLLVVERRLLVSWCGRQLVIFLSFFLLRVVVSGVFLCLVTNKQTKQEVKIIVAFWQQREAGRKQGQRDKTPEEQKISKEPNLPPYI